MLDQPVPLAGCNTERKGYAPPTYRDKPTAYGQWNRWDFLSKSCRQLGRYDHEAGRWVDLMDCRGCKAERDEGYIKQGRIDLDERAGR
jgi:hypothetical protein